MALSLVPQDTVKAARRKETFPIIASRPCNPALSLYFSILLSTPTFSPCPPPLLLTNSKWNNPQQGGNPSWAPEVSLSCWRSLKPCIAQPGTGLQKGSLTLLSSLRLVPRSREAPHSICRRFAKWPKNSRRHKQETGFSWSSLVLHPSSPCYTLGFV